jgi:hypothetical protein
MDCFVVIALDTSGNLCYLVLMLLAAVGVVPIMFA